MKALTVALGALALATPALASEVSIGGAYTAQGATPSSAASDVVYRPLSGSLDPYAAILIDPGRQAIFAGIGVGYRIPIGRFYVEPSIGGGAVTGPTEARLIGSRGVFRLEGVAGYRVTPKIAVEASVQHWSNGWLARPDDGLNVVSLRTTYAW